MKKMFKMLGAILVLTIILGAFISIYAKDSSQYYKSSYGYRPYSNLLCGINETGGNYSGTGGSNETDCVNLTADAGGSYIGVVNQSIYFDGSGSCIDNGTIIGYYWDFGDGSNGTGVSPMYSYSLVGNYSVSLTVTDNIGSTNSDLTEAVIVSNDPGNNSGSGNGSGTGGSNETDCVNLTADAGGSYIGVVNQSIYFDGSGSCIDNGTIIGYYWDFGDGSNGTGVSPMYSYSLVGNYSVSLTVTDNIGSTNSDLTEAVIVSNDPGNNSGNGSGTGGNGSGTGGSNESSSSILTAYAGGPYTGVVNSSIYFKGLFSCNYNCTITGYYWDFGDGYNSSEISPIHTYSQIGNYSVIFTITDNNGNASSDITEVNIYYNYNTSVGYFIVNDADGTYESFYSNITEATTSFAMQDDGTYLVDSNGDGEWDYLYDPVEGEVTQYESEQKNTPGFEIILVLNVILILLIYKSYYRKKKR